MQDNIKGGSRQTKRQEIRRKAHYELSTLTTTIHCSRNIRSVIAAIVPKQIKKLFEAIRFNKSSEFGIVSLNKLILESSNESSEIDSNGGLLLDMLFPVHLLDLKEYTSTMTNDNKIKFANDINTFTHISLLSYAIQLRRDVIVSALLRACVNPFTYNVISSSDDTSDIMSAKEVNEAIANYRESVPLPAFIWLLYQISTLKYNNKDNEICVSSTEHCSLCSKVVENRNKDYFIVASTCQHCTCLKCLWLNVRKFSNDQQTQSLDYDSYNTSLLSDSLYCPTCNAEIHIQGSSSYSQVILNDPIKCKQESLSKWLQLPQSPDSNELPISSSTTHIPTESIVADKMKFRAMSLTESAYYCLGSYQSQRVIELYKCIVQNNVRRLLALIDSGVCMDSMNQYHMTALCVAVMLNRIELVIVLLKAGADVFISNAAQGSVNSGCYILDIGRQLKYHDVVRVLMQYLIKYNLTSRLMNCGNTSRCNIATPVVSLDTINVNWLIPSDCQTKCNTLHHGAGKAFYIDNAFAIEWIDHINKLFRSLQLAEKQKELCSDRTYYCDVLGQFSNPIEQVVRHALQTASSDSCSLSCANVRVEVFPSMKLLDYTNEGGTSSPHIDLSKSNILTQRHSTFTFILYTSDCNTGGETALLRSVKGSWAVDCWDGNVLAIVTPRKGRLLVFPHNCPHAGLPTIEIPKTLLRGEILIESL